MNNGFVGNVMDVSSLQAIIKKLELLIEEEEKNIQNIKNSLSNLQGYYSGGNSTTIDSKISDLSSSLDEMLNNRRKYVAFINGSINSYVATDEQVATVFNKNLLY